MAFSLLSLLSSLILTLTLHQHINSQQLPLNWAEQESVYLALESVNPETPWRSLYPDDLCLSAPHGVVCGYFSNGNNDAVSTPHIIELSFGYVSDFSQNPFCSANSTFPLSVFSLSHLQKLFFYRCFTHNPVSLPAFNPVFGSDLQELVFMENPSLSGSLSGIIGNFTALRRFILTGSNVSGGIPGEFTKLPSLEQITISGNAILGGGVPFNFGKLGKLRVLDFSSNGLKGTVPDDLGQLKSLLKLDLSSNDLLGKIPESLKGLKSLEFLDLSHNCFGNFGVPLFLGEMTSLREAYLDGNPLGGAIPEIWENLGDILGIGLSGVGLVGNIPSSMGVFLRNLSYIRLDNNKLEGELPEEFGMLENLHEMNLQNNHLSGRIPFSAHFVAKAGRKLKFEGNSELCIDKRLKRSFQRIASLGRLRTCNGTVIPNVALSNGSPSLYLPWYLLIFLVGFLVISPILSL